MRHKMSFSSQRFCGFFDFSHSFLISTFPIALSTLTSLHICLDHLGHLLKHSFLNTEPLTCLVPWFLPLHPRPHLYPSSLRGHASASCFSPLLRRPAAVLGFLGQPPRTLPENCASSLPCSWDYFTLYHSRKWLGRKPANSAQCLCCRNWLGVFVDNGL